MLNDKRTWRTGRWRRFAAVVPAALLLGAALAPAAAAGGTAIAGCQAVADQDSHTIRITWQTTAEQQDDELLLDNTLDNGVNWEPVDAAIAGGAPQNYQSTDDWPPAGTNAGYRVTVLDAGTLEEGASVTCAAQIATGTAAAQPATAGVRSAAAVAQPVVANAQPVAPAGAPARLEPAAEKAPVTVSRQALSAMVDLTANAQPLPANPDCAASERPAASERAVRAPVAAGTAQNGRQPPGVAGAIAALGALIGGAGLLVWRRDVH